MSDAEKLRIKFYADKHLPDAEANDRELRALADRLAQKIDVDRYRTTQGARYRPPTSRGYASLPMLPELNGLPLTDLILAYVHALNPTSIRITTGAQTTDSCPGRVTIVVDPNDVVQSISQEVRVGYGCGIDVAACLAAARHGVEPSVPGGVIGDMSRLAKADFS